MEDQMCSQVEGLREINEGWINYREEMRKFRDESKSQFHDIRCKMDTITDMVCEIASIVLGKPVDDIIKKTLDSEENGAEEIRKLAADRGVVLPPRPEAVEKLVQKFHGGISLMADNAGSQSLSINEDPTHGKAYNILVVGASESEDKAYKVCIEMSKPNLKEDLKAYNILVVGACESEDKAYKVFEEMSQPNSINIADTIGAEGSLDEDNYGVIEASGSLASTEGFSHMHNTNQLQFPKCMNGMADKVRQPHSKPEIVEDAHHMFDEMLRPVPVSLISDAPFFRVEGNDYLSSKIKGLQFVCQLNAEMYTNCLSTKLLGNESSFLIDDGVILSFDPGGCSLSQMGCDLSEFNREQRDYCLVIIMVDVSVKVVIHKSWIIIASVCGVICRFDRAILKNGGGEELRDEELQGQCGDKFMTQREDMVTPFSSKWCGISTSHVHCFMNDFVKLLCTCDSITSLQLITQSAVSIVIIQVWVVCWTNSRFGCLPSFHVTLFPYLKNFDVSNIRFGSNRDIGTHSHVLRSGKAIRCFVFICRYIWMVKQLTTIVKLKQIDERILEEFPNPFHCKLEKLTECIHVLEKLPGAFKGLESEFSSVMTLCDKLNGKFQHLHDDATLDEKLSLDEEWSPSCSDFILSCRQLSAIDMAVDLFHALDKLDDLFSRLVPSETTFGNGNKGSWEIYVEHRKEYYNHNRMSSLTFQGRWLSTLIKDNENNVVDTESHEILVEQLDTAMVSQTPVVILFYSKDLRLCKDYIPHFDDSPSKEISTHYRFMIILTSILEIGRDKFVPLSSCAFRGCITVLISWMLLRFQDIRLGNFVSGPSKGMELTHNGAIIIVVYTNTHSGSFGTTICIGIQAHQHFMVDTIVADYFLEAIGNEYAFGNQRVKAEFPWEGISELILGNGSGAGTWSSMQKGKPTDPWGHLLEAGVFPTIFQNGVWDPGSLYAQFFLFHP